MILLILLCGIGIILYYYIPRQYRTIEMAKATIKYYLRRSNVTIENTQWYQRITFTHNGNIYHTTLPYTRKLLSKMSGRRVYLRTTTGDIDITHPVGIHYSHTAEQLGGIGYRVTSADDDLVFDQKTLITV